MQFKASANKVQHKIFTRIEKERAIVDGNWEFMRIGLREEKVKQVIERVWES